MKQKSAGGRAGRKERRRIDGGGKVLKRRSGAIGKPPGTLIHVGERKVEQPLVTMIAWNEEEVIERTLADPAESLPYRDRYRVVWVSIVGLHDVTLIARAGAVFGIDSLTLEDVLHTGQRAKVEDFEKYLYLVLQMLDYQVGDEGIGRDQLSLVLADGLVVTFQEKPGSSFDALRQRLSNPLSRARRLGADFLAYALVDAVVDHCLEILEGVENTIDRLEDGLLDNYDRDTFGAIYSLKRELIILRKSVWPLREAVGSLMRDEFKVVGEAVEPYFRDVYDHIILVIDTVEVFRDIVTGMQETYLAAVNNRMNEVMKFLTMIATIFMPLSFITGFYGMNFRYIPGLESPWGTGAVTLVMVLIIIGMVWFYRSRKWY